jgi:cell division septum initiation protein DivIVA
LWARYGYNKKRVEKKLKEVEQELQDYQEMKQRLSQRAAEQKPFDPAPAKDDFKKAAEPEAELIKKKQAELDRKLDAIKDLKPPRPEDKPKP